ncbi:COG1896: Predicted hydrolases of HD superfamily [Devosia sp. DBB001]|nr:COG1896: Predicted hydrolases of HD superfamily [Devosia sp. DBB001]
MSELSPFWVYTAAGLQFDFDNPRPEMIERRALAWQLSGEGRWANNTFWALSVAQHSMLVATSIRNPAWRVYGLLHDAAEAWTRDLSTPFKLWLASKGADVVGLERRILRDAVYPHFDLAPPTSEINAAVDEADARALATEYRDAVQGKGDEWVPGAPPFAAPVKFMPRDKAEYEFLRMLDASIRDAHKAGLRRVA